MAPQRQTVLSAIGLMTLSQFLHYQGTYNQSVGVAIGGGGGGDYARPDLNTGFAIAKAYDHIKGVSGWALHHHAWIFLAALAAVFGLGLKFGKAWEAWGYWVAVAGLACCLFPTDFTLAPPGLGFYVGGLAVLIAAWAAHLQSKSLKLQPAESIP